MLMKTIVLQRVIKIKDYKKLSVNKFAEQIKMAQTTVNNYFNGSRAVSLELIIAVLSAFEDISAEWLLRGKGTMLRTDKSVSSYSIKGTDNSVTISGHNEGDVQTNANSDKEIMLKLLEQNQQLINMMAKR